MINLFHIIEEKSTEEPTISINSVAGCLQALTECHHTINEQDASRFVISFFFLIKN
jgi:hypothetical protein